MEVHRISENTIRVTMDADELKERGITMLDLLGNKSQIQHFFYQILSEVDTDHTFAKGDPVTFQVMPSSSGLELLIIASKSLSLIHCNLFSYSYKNASLKKLTFLQFLIKNQQSLLGSLQVLSDELYEEEIF